MPAKIWKVLKRALIGVFGLVFVLGLVLVVYYMFTTPSHEGPWKPEYENLATATIEGEIITIKNFRRARYHIGGEPKDIKWETRQVSLADLKNVWFGISVFSDPGLAHTFLSFDFGDGDPVVVSVEARQTPDQHYSPISGVLDQYNLIYVMADEVDIIGVRTHAKEQAVYFQPLTISSERAEDLFIDMINRANELAAQPEFYNTLTANCTNSLLKNSDIAKWQLYLDWRLMLPGFSDRIAYEYGVLDQTRPRERLRQAAHLNPDHFEQEDLQFYRKVRESYFQNLLTLDALERVNK